MSINEYLDTIPKEIKQLFVSIRECIINAGPEFDEAIKWKNCLTYVYNSKNLIQTVLGKDKVSLIFHNGAKIVDEKGLLEGDGNKVRTLRINHENFRCETLGHYVRLAVSHEND